MLNSPLIYAHRGVSDTAKEHTKEAYLTAIKQGADGFECDVRLTADKEIICFHDATTKRTHNVDLRISSTSFAELNAKSKGLKEEKLNLDAKEYDRIQKEKELLDETVKKIEVVQPPKIKRKLKR